jgi:acetolactate synthase I/II/III large subunit
MRLSDYVIQFLRDSYKVDTFFTLSGGGCIFLMDSLGTVENVKYIANHHEQASAIAAEGYARMHDKIGCCIVTSGPGGTNTLTGVLCSWLDSIPMIVISGQVNKEMTTNYTNLPLRQLGDQEFNIIESVKNMTKYAIQVNDPSTIKYHLEKACKLATTGRPGPVWIDLPLNIQSSNINPNELIGYDEPTNLPEPSFDDIDHIITKLSEAKKPLLIIGNGIRLSGGIDELKTFLNKTHIPVITAVNGNDIINEDYINYAGRFGTHAQMCANNLLDECDFLLTIGSRLYIRQTGYNFKSFAQNAYKIYTDIDANELNKPSLFPDYKIITDAKVLLNKLNQKVTTFVPQNWQNYVQDKFKNNITVLDKHKNKTGNVSNYFFIEKLNNHLTEKDHIVTSDGSANVVTMQVMKLKGNQRLITNTGCAPMGYGLPAAIGASSNNTRIICLEGDGSLHLNIHELQTMKHNNLPIKLIILNNNGYLSIKLTQKFLFKGKYVASEKSSGVTFPDFEKLMNAYDLPYFNIKNHSEIDYTLEKFLKNNNPSVLEVFIDENEPHEPRVIPVMDKNNNFTPGKLSDIQWIPEF